MTKTGTETYYAQRAREYDRVYDKPERQNDLHRLQALVPPVFEGKHVLEVAAGTGYWTQFYADDAAAVVATDLNTEVLDVARDRRPWPTTEFRVVNVFELDKLTDTFDAAFAGFFWSHVQLDQLPLVVQQLVGCLGPGSPVMFIDNRYVEGSNHPVTRTDAAGNTYQHRMLADGTEWEVLKNFPTTHEVIAALAPALDNVQVTELEYFWVATGSTPEPHNH